MTLELITDLLIEKTREITGYELGLNDNLLSPQFNIRPIDILQIIVYVSRSINFDISQIIYDGGISVLEISVLAKSIEGMLKDEH